MEKQCRFSNKRLFKKYKRDQEASHLESIQDDSIPELPQPPEVSYCLPMPPPAFDNGEDDFSVVEENRTTRGEDVTTGKEDVTIGKDNVKTGKDNVTTGKDNVKTGKDNVTTGKDNVKTGKEDVTTGKGDVTIGKGDVTAWKGDVTTGKGDVTMGKGDVIMGKGDVTTGKGDVTTRQEDVTTGQEDVTTVKGDVTSGQEDVTTGQEDVTTGEEDFTTGVNDIIVDEASTINITENRKFKCSKCGKTFRKYGSAKGHCKGKDSLKCPLCGKVIKHRSNKARHISRCYKKREKSTSNAKETNHSADQTTIQCSLCNKTYNNPASLRAHLSYKHGGNRDGHFKCEKCDFVTNLESELRRHTTLKHMQVKFECPKCDYSCSSASGMKKHRLAVHRTQSSSFQKPVGLAVNSQTPEKTVSGQGKTPYLHSSAVPSFSVIAGLGTSSSDIQTDHSLEASSSYMIAGLQNTSVPSYRHPTDITDVYVDDDQGNFCDKSSIERTLAFSDY